MATLADFHRQASLGALQGQIEEARPTLRLMLRVVALLRRWHWGCLVLLVLGLFGVRRRWFAVGQSRIYAVSLTPNNARILEKLGAQLAKAGVSMSINAASFPWSRRFALLRHIPILARQLQADGDPRDFTFLHQVIGAPYILLFAGDLSRVNPQLVVAANDHSPPTVALLAVARALGVKSCYVQHGPITPSFPPLSTDLALLFSAQAAEVYRTAAAARGVTSPTQVMLFPPLSAPLVPMRPPGMPMRVCIALSFFPDLAGLTRLLGQLNASPHVGTVQISQHPRCTKNIAAVVGGRAQVLPVPTTAEAIAPQVDLCLVENSGVALEFLHFGCPTFYLKPADPGLDDYYGFVRDGILPRFVPSVVESPDAAVAFFDGAWRKKMGQVDPVFEAEPTTYYNAVTTQIKEMMGDASKA